MNRGKQPLNPYMEFPLGYATESWKIEPKMTVEHSQQGEARGRNSLIGVANKVEFSMKQYGSSLNVAQASCLWMIKVVHASCLWMIK